MFVIEVIPLRRGSHIESLSYYSGVNYSAGTIITVPVRNQNVPALVTDIKEVSATKAALRAATFSLRKLPPQEHTLALSPAFISTAKQLARYYACQTGAVIYEMLPPEVRSGKLPLPMTHHVTHDEHPAPSVLVDTTHERYIAYRSLVRETFAHSGSVLFVVPSSAEIQDARVRLESGIENRIIELSAAHTSRALKKAFEQLEDFSKSKLIITTPSYAVLERHDITLTIIEREHSGHYRTRTRPYLDYRDVLRVHAKEMGRSLVFGDLLLRNETEYYRREEHYHSFGETSKRIALPGKLALINQNDAPKPDVPFKLFSEKVLDAIEKTRAARGKTFIFSARRGLAPVVACIDCGYIFRSPESGAPYSLIRTEENGKEARWFVCGVSGHRERAADTCPTCGSWRLRERGIGIQYVYDELSRLLDGVPLIIFDHTTAGTLKKALFLRDKFYSTKGAILIGTHMVLPYLVKPIDTGVVVSMDALRATPTWRQQEETFSVLLSLREHTTDTLYVQTRTGSDEIVEYAKRGALERFHTDEIELRKMFNYPPFSVFVHLTWQGTKETAQAIEKSIRDTLKRFDVKYYSAPPSTKATQIQYALIRHPAVDWPDTKLTACIRSLPPSVRVVINPDRIV